MLVDTYSWHCVQILSLVRESPRSVSVCIEKPARYDYVSGQHTVVRVTMPSGVKLIRQYSFASSPLSSELWLTIIHEPEGEVSGWFASQARTGITIDISQPLSGPLQHILPYDKNCMMIAGGSGIVPIMSHLRYVRHMSQPPNLTLLYSTPTDSRCYIDELKSICPNETIIVHTTDTMPRFQTAEIISLARNADIVLICGSRSFATAIRQIAETIVPADQIFAEAFSL